MHAARRSFNPKGKRIAVTGAGGFIGGRTCARLGEAGAAVLGLDSNPEARDKVEGTGAEFRVADVTDAAALATVLGGGIDGAVHTAALVGDWMTMEDAVRVNVGGTGTFLRAARDAGAKRYVHLSSVVVYGHEAAGEQDETAPLRALGIPYVDTKSASDRVARGLGAIVVRPGDVYGPGSVPWTVRILETVKTPGAVLPPAAGRMLPVYVDDLVEAALAALERGRPGEAYAAWSGEEVTFGEYFDAHARMAGRPPLRRVSTPVATGLAAVLEAGARLARRPPLMTRFATAYLERPGTVSTQKAREELGWEPQVPLEEGLRRSEAWLRAEGLM